MATNTKTRKPSKEQNAIAHQDTATPEETATMEVVVIPPAGQEALEKAQQQDKEQEAEEQKRIAQLDKEADEKLKEIARVGSKGEKNFVATNTALGILGHEFLLLRMEAGHSRSESVKELSICVNKWTSGHNPTQLIAGAFAHKLLAPATTTSSQPWRAFAQVYSTFMERTGKDTPEEQWQLIPVFEDDIRALYTETEQKRFSMADLATKAKELEKKLRTNQEADLQTETIEKEDIRHKKEIELAERETQEREAKEKLEELRKQEKDAKGENKKALLEAIDKAKVKLAETSGNVSVVKNELATAKIEEKEAKKELETVQSRIQKLNGIKGGEEGDNGKTPPVGSFNLEKGTAKDSAGMLFDIASKQRPGEPQFLIELACEFLEILANDRQIQKLSANCLTVLGNASRKIQILLSEIRKESK